MDFQPDEEIAFKRNPEVVLLDEDEEASKATVKKMPSAEPTPRRNSVPSPVATVPSAPGQMDLWGPYPSGRSFSIPCNNKPGDFPRLLYSVSVLGAQVYGTVSTFSCPLLRPSQ